MRIDIQHAPGFGGGMTITDEYENTIRVEYHDLSEALLDFKLKNNKICPDEMLEWLSDNFPSWGPDENLGVIQDIITDRVKQAISDNIEEIQVDMEIPENDFLNKVQEITGCNEDQLEQITLLQEKLLENVYMH